MFTNGMTGGIGLRDVAAVLAVFLNMIVGSCTLAIFGISTHYILRGMTPPVVKELETSESSAKSIESDSSKHEEPAMIKNESSKDDIVAGALSLVVTWCLMPMCLATNTILASTHQGKHESFLQTLHYYTIIWTAISLGVTAPLLLLQAVWRPIDPKYLARPSWACTLPTSGTASQPRSHSP